MRHTKTHASAVVVALLAQILALVYLGSARTLGHVAIMAKQDAAVAVGALILAIVCTIVAAITGRSV